MNTYTFSITSFISPIKHRLLLPLLLIVLSGSNVVFAAAPTITSFSPLSGPITTGATGTDVGTEVTIIGTGFSTTASVFFGTIKAVVTGATSTQLTVWVPQGFSHERITVRVNNLSVTSTQYFLVTSTYQCALTQYSFQNKVDFAAGNTPNYITSGDIDGDGQTDLVVSNLLGQTISIYKNTTSAETINASSFAPSTLNCNFGIASVLLNDIDGDQKPDLLVATNSNSHVLIYRNTSTPGTITFAATPNVTGFNTSALKIAIADLDLDGKADLITTNDISSSVSLLRNISTPGSIVFDAAYNIPVSVIPTAITTGDLNRDGKPEIIISTNGSTNVKIILNNGSSGGFNSFSFDVSTFLSTTASITSDVELADIDSDGLLDIVVSNFGSNASNRSITILKNTFSQSTTVASPPSFTKAGDYAVADGVSDVAIADFNGDGRPDMAASIKLTNSVALYLNTLTTSGTIDAASFSIPTSFAVGKNPIALCTADFDNDGKADIATANSDATGSMSVLKRVAQTIPEGEISNLNAPVQVTICPSTETSLDVAFTGKSPFSFKYTATDFFGSTTTTVTNIAITNADGYGKYHYVFNVSPEVQTRYELIYVNDNKQCNNYYVNESQNAATVKLTTTDVLTPNTIPHATVGSTYNQRLTLDPGTPPLSWSISSGLLPPGLTFASGLIDGTPTARDAYSFTVTAAFSNCDAIKQYHILCTTPGTSTTWNGTGWSNGEPDNLTDAIIDGNYNTAVNRGFKCFHLAVNEGDTLLIKGTNTITVAGKAINNGVIYKDCSATLAITGTFAGKAIKILQPQILPTFLPNGLVNLTYTQPLQVSIGASPTYTLTGTLPTGLSLINGTIAAIAGNPSRLGRYDFSLRSTEYNGLCEASGNFTIIIETVDPTLKFPANGITKFTGTSRFKYAPTTKSNGTITYSIEPANGCATIDANDTITITCGEPIKQYTITAIQQANFIYKADTATTILTIEKSKPEFHFLKTGYILGSTTGNTIQYQTNSTGAVTVFQVNNSNVAVVNMLGVVTPVAAGTFDILLKIAATSNSLALDTLITMGVYSGYVPPVSVPISITLEMGKDSTFNILTSAQGITGAINAALTDIDIENTGVQYRFYSTELGNFLLDNNGNLTVRPFSGFIGVANIGYVLTDENGTTSEVYYITVIVNPPYVIPDLKANDTMTPNNDGLNDTFVIAYTDITKTNSLIILDEAGSTIYSTTNYQNDWSGTTNKGDQLEPGVYFYAFKETYSGRKLNGYIQIVK